MRRSLLLTAVLTAVVVTLLGPAPQATATPDSPVGVHPEWGHTAEKGTRIKRGCHRYTYSYTLTPPDGDWQLETFLVGPGGAVVASDWLVPGGDGLSGTSTWRLCHRTVRSGRYTIRALLTVDNVVEQYAGWLPETTFRLRPPKRR